MAELSQGTKNLIAKYELWSRLNRGSTMDFPSGQNSLKPKENISTIHVDEVALKVAAFYEHIRTIVDWKEEHLMQRAAIIRKLKRRFLDLELNNFSAKDIAEPLVLELIRGGYFPNDKIEETKIFEAQKIIDKYIFILKNNPESKKGESKLQFYNFLLEIAACEIEECLAPFLKEIALIDYMFQAMCQRIKVNENIYQRNLLTKEEPARNAFGIADAGGGKDIQIYIAVQRALFKLDDPIIGYNLIKHKYTQWENPTKEELLELAKNIYNIVHAIESNLTHPLRKKFYSICEKYDTAYLLVGDILSKNNIEKAQQYLSEPSLLEGQIRESYAKRLKDLKDKITRAAFYSTVSIFITKILSLLIIEIILAKIFNGNLQPITLLIDILIPTVLMAVLVISIKPPSKKNLNLVIVEIMKIVYQKEDKDTYQIKVTRKRGTITKLILSLTYLAGACASLGAIYWIFNYFQFPIISIIINIIFIALILFAGTAIQKRSQELTIEEGDGGFLVFTFDILFLPITGVGHWISNKWKRYNAIAAFFNALIDMPFSTFVEFLERWRGFIKEKKEELR